MTFKVFQNDVCLTCLIGQNINQYTRDSSDVIQQQTGNVHVVLDSSDSQFSRADIERQKDLNKLVSITEEEILEQGGKQRGERVHEAYHLDRSPVSPAVAESYESLVKQEFQQKGYRIAEDSSIFTKKRERNVMCVGRSSDSNDTWKQRGYHMCHNY